MEVQRAVAELDWRLTICCPKCKEITNLLQQDYDGDMATAIFNNKWEKLENWEVTCDSCDYEFKVSEVVY